MFIPLFLLSALFNICLGVHKPKLPQQCACDSTLTTVGTLPPVFPTCDKYGNIDVSKIRPYAKLLAKSGINGVIVGSALTGWVAFTTEERMESMKAWCDLKKEFGLSVVCQVGGSTYNDTLQLVKYGVEVGCDAFASGSEVYYKAGDVQGVIRYLKGIAKSCYPLPLIYVDRVFPECGFDYNVAKVNKLGCEQIKNYGGIISNTERCLQVIAVSPPSSKRVVISFSSFDIVAYQYCFNGTSTLIANVLPEMVVKVQQAVLNGQIDKAIQIQKTMNTFYGRTSNLNNAPDRFDRSLLNAQIQLFRELIFIVNGIDLGKNRIGSQPKLSRDEVMRLYKICQEFGFAKRKPSDYDDNDSDKNNDNTDNNNSSSSTNNNSSGKKKQSQKTDKTNDSKNKNNKE